MKLLIWFLFITVDQNFKDDVSSNFFFFTVSSWDTLMSVYQNNIFCFEKFFFFNYI